MRISVFLNSQTPTNQGKIKEETTNDIDSVIRRVPFPSLLRDVEGNEAQSNKDDAGRDEYHRAGDTAEQETPRSPRNGRGTPQNEYGAMEYSPGATAPSNDHLLNVYFQGGYIKPLPPLFQAPCYNKVLLD